MTGLPQISEIATKKPRKSLNQLRNDQKEGNILSKTMKDRFRDFEFYRPFQISIHSLDLWIHDLYPSFSGKGRPSF